jgi:hypothetical protein
MASVFVDIPGIGNVEAKNAATEATLREILKVMQGIDKNTASSLKEDKKGRDEDKKGGKEGGDKASPMGKLGKAVGTMLRPIQMVTGGFIALGSASTSLIQSFANAGDSMSGAAQVFSKIPVLGGIFSAVAGAADKVLGSYQSATASGATFGNSINNFAAASSGAGLTMEKFGAIIAKNGDSLMILGGTTEEGAKRFADMSKQLRTSQVGAQLAGLGMSTAEINQGMASYVKVMGSSGALQGKSNKEIAAGAGAYLKEMDALAKVTGRNRAELEAEAEARAKDAQWIAMTTGMDKDQRAMMESFVSSFPKSQQAAIKDMLTTGNITSDAAVKFNAMMGGTAQEVMQMGNAIKDGRKVTQGEVDKLKNNSVAEAQAKRSSAEFKTMGQYVPEFAETVQGINELAQQEVGGRKKALTAQEQAEKSQAAAMEKNKQSIAAMSNSFQMVLANSGILDTLMKLFQFTADITMKYLVPAFNLFAFAISGVVNSFVDILGPSVSTMGDIIMKYLYPAFQSLVAFVVVDMLPGIMKAVSDFVPVIAAVADVLMPPIKSVAEFIFANLTPILSGLAVGLGLYGAWIAYNTVVGWAATAAKIAETAATIPVVAALMSMAAAALAAIIPFWPLIAVVTLAALYFKKMGGDLTVMGDGLKYMWEGFKSFFTLLKMGFLKVLNTISFGAVGGDALKEAEQEYVDQVAEREKLAKQMSDRMADNREEADKKEQKREDVKQALDIKAIKEKRAAADAAKDANKKEAEAKEEAVKDYANPTALLKQEAAQQKSAFIKDVPNSGSGEGAKKAMVADADAKKAAEEKAKADAEKKAEDAKKGTGGSGGKTGPAPATQESAETLLASLNTKMDQLIKINKGSHDVHEQQLSVQKSLSGDLYQNIV